MSDAVVAIDLGEEFLKESDALNEWFSERGYKMNDDTIVKGDNQVGFSHYGRAGVVIYRFDNTDEYFPEIVMDFIGNLKDGENTTISVAEDGPTGFDTIVEMNLADFTKHILNGEDPVEEGDE